MQGRRVPRRGRVLGVASIVAALAHGVLPAKASDVPFSALRGKSIVAEYKTAWVARPEGQAGDARGSARFTYRIYVSEAGKTFFNRRMVDAEAGPARPVFDFETVNQTDKLNYVGSGFVFRGVPSQDKEHTTFAEVVRIEMNRRPDGLACTISRTRALKVGEVRYITYIHDNPPYLKQEILSDRFSDPTCTVADGNVFARGAN
jgi:hypothetical protein